MEEYLENIFLFFSDTMVPMKNEFNNTESKNNVNPSEQGRGSGAVVHKRRPRYKGTHPRKFSEKYKELNPELYPETIEKVIAKGSTPAGMHIPIAVQEILDVLAIKEGENGLDCTLGYGGHTRRMLEQLNGKGHLTSLDVDSENIVRTEGMLRKEGFGEEILSIRHINFQNLDQAAEEQGKFDFILADLGVSSMQIDEPERGFSWKHEGPLDLRLDQKSGEPASERLKELEWDELAGMLMENADEPYAEEIARTVTRAIYHKKPVETTTQLAELIREAVTSATKKDNLKKGELEDLLKKSCTRTFQALRIDINQEYEVLYNMLEKLPEVLKEGGRVAILTFHSGEDRIVKKEFKRFYKEGLFSEIAKDAIRPSKEECFRNPRARSAKLRWAVK